MKRNFKCIKQHDLKDCGPACLSMIARHYGFTMSISKIREIAKQISKANYEVFLNLSNGEIFEDSMIKGIVIATIKDYDLQINYLDSWIKTIDSWGLVDSVVSTMKWLKKQENKEKYFYYFYNLCFSHEEYVARFGIVTIMSYYIEEKYIDKIFEMCEKVKDQKYYIQMAIAWLISVLFVKFSEKTYKFLQKQVLFKFTQNKAISKCRESFRVSKEDKERLNNLKIK